MRNMFTLLFATLRAKVMPIWMKLKLWTSPAFIRTKVLAKVRDFFTRLLDVRPRHKKDYYGMFRWLVSKRLAFAIVIVLGMAAIVYIALMVPARFAGKDAAAAAIPTYKYRSIPLKFHEGTVQILARDGHVAYVGDVAKGSAAGSGTLYDKAGDLVYEGDFQSSMYNGQGTLYYPGGALRYRGQFTDNLFNGVGNYYRLSGSLEYTGDYVAGVRTGLGKLFNSAGSPIFEGSFLNNNIVFSDFLGKPTTETAQLYTGQSTVYDSGSEYCVSMPEIGAVYAVKDGSNTLENEWTVSSVYVLSSNIALDGQTFDTIAQLQSVFGEPIYFGTAWVDLPESVAINQLTQAQPELMLPVELMTEASFDNVFNVTSYDRNYQIYLYTFQRDGLLYSFYAPAAGQPGFFMYALEIA